MNSTGTVWPTLSYPAWRDTAVTLQLWTQIVGKIRLALTPWVNHGWHVTLYATARGLGTSPIPIKYEIFEIEFDFISHRLIVRTSWGAERVLPLEPQTVTDFYCHCVILFKKLGFFRRPSSELNRRDGYLGNIGVKVMGTIVTIVVAVLVVSAVGYLGVRHGKSPG
jgi:Family of unknown function (DUF5996)